MEPTTIKDTFDLTRLGLSTFLNIGQMTHYRLRYLTEKELLNAQNSQVSINVLNQDRDKMIYHTCLAGLCVAGLLAIGIVGLTNRE